MLDPENGGSILLRKVGNFSPVSTVEHARRFKSSPKYKLFKRLVLDKIHWPKKIGVDCSTEHHSLFALLLQGKLSGFGINEKVPTIAVVAYYDSFGVAPVSNICHTDMPARQYKQWLL